MLSSVIVELKGSLVTAPDTIEFVTLSVAMVNEFKFNKLCLFSWLSFQRSQNQLWNNDGDFQNSLNSWATAAPSHGKSTAISSKYTAIIIVSYLSFHLEREIVKNLLKRLNGGQTPAEFANR